MGAAAAVLRARQGPAAGGGRPLRRRAPGVLRHRDLRLGDAARSRLGAVQQDHGRAVRHPDGRRAARPRPPPADAGVLVAADRAARRRASPRSSTACSTASRPTGPRSTACRTTARISSSMPCSTPWSTWTSAARRSSSRSTTSFRAPPTSSRASRGPPELRRAFDRTMEEIKVIIDERRVSAAPGLHQRSRQRARRRRQAQRPRAVRPDFRHLRRVAVGHQPRRRRRALPALHARRPAPRS